MAVKVYRDEEEYYRNAAKLISDVMNTYASLLRGKRSEKQILYAAMLDIALRYQKEAKRNDTAPINDILGKLTSEIEEALK
jgi:cell division protein ZapA